MAEQKITFSLTVIEANDLYAGDSNGLSDPYLKIPHKQIGIEDLPGKKNRTEIIEKTLNPVWNQTFCLEFNPQLCKELKIEVYDYDYFGKDDLLGTGIISLEWMNTGELNTFEEWIPLNRIIDDKNSKTTQNIQKGSVHIKLEVMNRPAQLTLSKSVQANKINSNVTHSNSNNFNPLSYSQSYSGNLAAPFPEYIINLSHKKGDVLQPGTWIPLDEPQVMLGLGWDFTGGETFDLDASITAVDYKYNIIESVYYCNKKGLNNSVIHYGDNLTGKGEGDDEVMKVILNKIPPNVHFLAVTINSYKKNSIIKAKSAYIRLFTCSYRIGKYVLKKTKDCIGLLLGVFERGPSPEHWYFRVMADPIKGNKITSSYDDIITLLGNYSFINFNNKKRINHPLKGEPLFELNKWIKLENRFTYIGLGWNIQQGLNFDLDASILTFDKENNLMEMIYHKNKHSYNNSIIHLGDNRTGIGEGDDEVLTIDFGNINCNVFTMTVIINSFKGNSLVNILDAFIRLYDTQKLLGVHILNDCPDSIGLCLGIFKKDDEGFWYFSSIKEIVSGNVCSESVNDVKNFLGKYLLKV